MRSEPCKVCGNTDLNLIDGYYYCVECGTQDENVRETLVENVMLADGTYGVKVRTKVTKIVQEQNTMSPEWHKWHAYNYILAGLADEVVALGVGPSFKTKVLWLWTMYVKKFQKKKELGLTLKEGEDDEIEDVSGVNQVRRKNMRRSLRRAYNVAEPSNNLFFTILYLALNFDKSDIQLTQLIRFVQEGRLSYATCTKFVPKDIDVAIIDGWWKTFCRPLGPTIQYTLAYSMTYIKTFNLGPPVVPNLLKIVDNFVKDLCLPEDFKHLVYSLMQLVPCHHLDWDASVMTSMIRVPFYECIAMSYVLVALKMCFGLDDEYEIKLSDAVDSINEEDGHMKSYKLGVFSTESDRLFSFREWCTFLQLRKMVLCKYYWPMAEARSIDADDYVYAEQRNIPETIRKKPSLRDDITMNILDKIQAVHNVEVIPKSAFPPSLTPLSTYTDVILQHYNDPELRLLLSEDFTQYSLKYACEHLDLRVTGNSENVIVGVDESNKCVNSDVCGKLSYNSHDKSMVYVRNCQNKNWLKTNHPTINHIKRSSKNGSDNENDHSYDSSTNVLSDSELVDQSTIHIDEVKDDKEKLECKLEEEEQKNIFDDNFCDLEEYEEKEENIDIKQEPTDVENNDIEPSYHEDLLDSKIEDYGEENPDHSIEYFFNPETFDREKTIRELVLKACSEYRIRVPSQYETRDLEKRKRKRALDNKELETRKLKKIKTNLDEGKENVNNLLAVYFDHLKNDAFNTMSEQLRSIFQGLRSNNELNATNEQVEEFFAADANGIDEVDNRTIDDNEENESQRATDDPSLVDVANETADSDLPDELSKWDPKFDEKEYDTRQLYVRIQNESDDENDLFEIDNDPEINKILDKKIKESKVFIRSLKQKQAEEESKGESEDSDWDDNIPLQMLKEEKLAMLSRQKEKESLKDLEHLIKNRKTISRFNYWTKHYNSNLMRCTNLSERFTAEIKENFPKSFSFIIQECAAMMNCTPYLLYKAMVNVERVLLGKC